MKPAILISLLLTALPVVAQDGAPRARDLGIPFAGTPGPLNAITDVAGVTVGFTTIIDDLDAGKAVRTGVTAILPRGPASNDRPVFGGWFSLNGNGEMTGTTWVEESGFVEGPIMITNTHSVGAVHEGTIKWRIEQGAADSSGYWWSLPVVAETWDGYLNDINGLHVRPEHAFAALDAAGGKAHVGAGQPQVDVVRAQHVDGGENKVVAPDVAPKLTPNRLRGDEVLVLAPIMFLGQKVLATVIVGRIEKLDRRKVAEHLAIKLILDDR